MHKHAMTMLTKVKISNVRTRKTIYNKDKIMNGQNRTDIKIGALVKVVLKADQKTGKLTEGEVSQILTNSSFHPHGIKVKLKDGQVGRVQEIL